MFVKFVAKPNFLLWYFWFYYLHILQFSSQKHRIMILLVINMKLKYLES